MAVYFTNFLLNACQAVPLHSPLFSVGLWLFLLVFLLGAMAVHGMALYRRVEEI